MTGTDVSLMNPFVVATENCRPENLDQVGGKAVGLGSLMRAGQRVPASFVVTAAAHLDYIGSEPRRLIEPVRQAIADAYSALCAPNGGDLSVAVRSSATVEDSTEASCAGQFRTYLGAAGAEEVLYQVEQCWIAALEPHVGSYRADRQIASGDDAVAVVVQDLVDARAAGVMFTQHPRTGDRSLVVIEASYGLGEAVVGGEITPDLFEVNRITQQVHHSSMGAKPIAHRLAPDRRGVRTVPVEPELQQSWSVTDDEVMALVAMAGDLESKLGRGLDVEWAIGRTGGSQDEALFALQVRPITVGPRHRAASTPNMDAIDHILGRFAGREPGNADR